MLNIFNSPLFHRNRFFANWGSKFLNTEEYINPLTSLPQSARRELFYRISGHKGRNQKHSPFFVPKRSPVGWHKTALNLAVTTGTFVKDLFVSERHSDSRRTYKGIILLKSSSGIRKPHLTSNPALFQLYTDNCSKLWVNRLPKNLQQLAGVRLNSLIFHVKYWSEAVATISRAYGSVSKVLARDPDDGFLLVKLPSGVRLFLSPFTQAQLTTPEVPNKINSSKFRTFFLPSKARHSKAGYSMSLGNKPKVRGVAKNPVDHPHGGRTKSIKCPKTPWGLVAKKK